MSSAEIILIEDATGDSEAISLSGSSTAHVFFEGPTEGDAFDDNNDGFDEVATELVAMNLTGTSSLGPIEVRLNPIVASPGMIEEDANAAPGTLDLPPFQATGSAEAFYDVFLEIEFLGMVLENQIPMRLSSNIFHKPAHPGAVFQSPVTIPLFLNGNPSGFSLGPSSYQPVPPSNFGDVEIDPAGNLVFTDTENSDNDLTLSLINGGTTVRIFDPNINVRAGAGMTQNGPNAVTVPLADITGGIIDIDGLGGDDTLSIDLGSGNFVAPVTRIEFDGGDPMVAPGDELRLVDSVGVGFTDATFDFVDASSGSVDITGQATITYTGLEPITALISATNVTLNYSSMSETITVTDAGSGQTQVDSNAAEVVTFNNPSGTLAINAGNTGDDVIDLTSLPANYPAHLTIDGQSGTDIVNVDGPLSFAAGESLTLDADQISVGSSVATTGDGVVDLIAGRDLQLLSGSSISTVDGGITLSGNANGTATGTFAGVTMDNASLLTTGSGNISILGTGGTSGSDPGGRTDHWRKLRRIDGSGCECRIDHDERHGRRWEYVQRWDPTHRRDHENRQC